MTTTINNRDIKNYNNIPPMIETEIIKIIFGIYIYIYYYYLIMGGMIDSIYSKILLVQKIILYIRVSDRRPYFYFFPHYLTILHTPRIIFWRENGEPWWIVDCRLIIGLFFFFFLANI